jgi:hypothetical protein
VKYLKTFFFILFAVAAGIGVAVYRIAGVEKSEALFHNGSWMGSKNLPLGKDNLLTAQVTLFALFALPGEEAIYLFSKRDNNKELLHSDKDYTISGNVKQIHSKYWSITAYGKDLFLVPNEAERYSFNNTNIQTDTAGNFVIHISHKRKEGNWLPSPESARFNLVLRIYKGEKEFLETLSETPLPEIKIEKQ